MVWLDFGAGQREKADESGHGRFLARWNTLSPLTDRALTAFSPWKQNSGVTARVLVHEAVDHCLLPFWGGDTLSQETEPMTKSPSVARMYVGLAIVLGVASVAFLSKGAWAEDKPALSSADDRAIRITVIDYLKAKNWKERLPFVIEPTKQEAAMQEKYKGVEFRLENPEVRTVEEFAKVPGTFLVKATWKPNFA